MRSRTLAAVCASALALTTLGQQQPPNPSPDTDAAKRLPTPATKPAGPRMPALLGDDGKPIEGVRLTKADVKAVVRGVLAEASITLTFRNDTPRVLGGELTFPLPDGATVAGYALDVNGTLVDGVSVEKQRARVIYEKEMNKSVDPGLVEHVAGNNFRTRLYPVPANGTRTLRVTYVADLVPSADGKGASFIMPMGLGEKLETLDLTVAVEGATEPPSVKGGSYTSKPFEGSARGYYLQDSLRDAKALDVLTIALPEVPATSAIVQKRGKAPMTVEELEAASKPGAAAQADEHFFVLTDTPKRPTDQLTAKVMKNQRVLVVWDASLSRLTADTARELKLLEQTLARLGHPTLDVLLLRNDVEVKPFLGGDAAGTAKVIDLLKNVKYDGGTNLSALSIPKNLSDVKPAVEIAQAQKDYDLAMVFTDGLATVGSEKPGKIEVPVYALSSDPAADHAGLRAICQSSGGVYLNLNREQDAAAIDAIGKPPFSIIGIEADPKQVAEVTPGVGTAVGGRVTVAGRLIAPEAKVTLVYGFGKVEAGRQTFTLKAADATEGMLVPRFWAQQKVTELAQAADGKRDELVKLGKQFSLVTPATSLLVLETADQYVQYGVVPPKSQPALYKEFSQKIENRKVEEAKTKEQKIQQVLAMWEAQEKWWRTDFKYPANLKVAPADPRTAAGLAADGAAAGPVIHSPTARPDSPRPVPAPLPPPPAGGAPNAPASPAPEPAVVSSTSDRGRERLMQLERGGRGPGGAGGVPREAAPDRDGVRLGRALKDSKGDPGEDESVSRIEIKPWDPNTPYIAAMKAVKREQAYDVYLQQREQYAKSPAFYLDCAEFFLRERQQAAGVRVLTDVAELKLEDARLLRVAAHRLQQVGELDLAITLFERVEKLRPEEPQSFRDLALALAARADAMVAANEEDRHTGQIVTDYSRALNLLNKVITSNWDRFPEIEVIALMEANAILDKLHRKAPFGTMPMYIDPRLRLNMPCDIRIVLTWDADMTDVDLWVTEPSGEICMYNHNRTQIGGLVSKDFTQGYGPEEYCLKKMMPGKYIIQANYYGSRQQELTGPCTVQATVITDFGKPTEKRESLTLRLATQKETATIGTVTLGGPGGAKAEPATQPASPTKTESSTPIP
jgi:Ca-activated chloride channel homolog